VLRRNGQSRSLLDLDAFADLVQSRRAEWAVAGIEASLHRSPDDGRNKASAWVTLKADVREGMLIVWDSGEGELQYLGNGEVVCRHLEGLDSLGAHSALADLAAAVLDPAD